MGRSVSILRGLRVALICVFVASLLAGSHLAADQTAAADPTPTDAWFDSIPELWIVNQQAFVRVKVSPAPDGGSVDLKIDGTTYETKASGPFGVTDFFWTPDTSKTYTLQAFYSGTASFAASQTAPTPVQVGPPPPSNVAFDVSATTLVRNEEVDFTATVTPNPGPGNIEWRLWDGEVLATTAVDVNGTATWSTSFDTPGEVWVRAKWDGNDAYGPRYSDRQVLTVLADTLGLSVSVPGTPLPPGEVAASVTLAPNPGSGVLEWKTCQDCLENEVAVDPDGTTSIDLGTYSTVSDYYQLFVRYPAQGDWAEATGQTQFAIWNATATTLATDRTTAYVGELPVKLIAAVGLDVTPAQGDITFLDDVGGGVVELGPVSIDPYTFQATFSSNSLRIGTHTIRARYSGQYQYLGSTSAPVTVVVGADSAVHATFSSSLAKFYPAKDGYKDTVKLGGTLSERASVTIKVFNSAGTLRRTWSLGWRNPGAYSATWNGRTASGSSLPAGTYTVKAYFKDSLGHTRTLVAKTAISWRQVVWKSVAVLKYAQAGSYYVGEFGGAIYYSPDYPKGRILDSGEMIRDCVDCGFAAGHLVFTVVSTDALAYRKLYIEIKGHGFSDREHPGSHGLIDPRTGHLALINANYEFDDPDVHWGIPFTSAYISSTHHIDAWIWMTQAWGDAYDLNWMRLTYQYAVWK
jgi:hypothetical protein